MKCKSNKYYQWDVNQYLNGITDEYVDFIIEGEPYRLRTVEESVKIPDKVFQTAGQKIAYLCYPNGTRDTYLFFVTARPMPPDYVYTEAERITFDSLTESVRTALEDLQIRVERGDFNGRDGKDGKDGKDGRDGKNGTDGIDGFSPSAKVERDEVQKKATITITDKDGTTTAEVFDGKDGGGSGEVTKEAIEEALGYTPISDTDYATASKAGVVKTSTNNGTQMGAAGVISTYPATNADINARTSSYKIISPKNLEYAVTSVVDFEFGEDEEVTFVEEGDLEGYPKDVQINGVSIINGGVANIPKLAENLDGFGLPKANYGYITGIGIDASGYYKISPATNAEIDAKGNTLRPITPANLEYAVKSIGDSIYKKKYDTVIMDEVISTAVKVLEFQNLNLDSIFIYFDFPKMQESYKLGNTAIYAKRNGGYITKGYITDGNSELYSNIGNQRKYGWMSIEGFNGIEKLSSDLAFTGVYHTATGLGLYQDAQESTIPYDVSTPITALKITMATNPIPVGTRVLILGGTRS